MKTPDTSIWFSVFVLLYPAPREAEIVPHGTIVADAGPRPLGCLWRIVGYSVPAHGEPFYWLHSVPPAGSWSNREGGWVRYPTKKEFDKHYRPLGEGTR